MKGITVQELVNDTDYGLELKVISGSRGLSKRIYNPRIQKLGLIIAGFMVYLHPYRVQILGNTEISYLRQLSREEGERIVTQLCQLEVVCFVITRNLKAPDYLLARTEERGIALLRTKLVTSAFIERVTKCLEDHLAPSGAVHGVLMDIMGVGTLILGRSGIGKSESALELIMRGYRLVSDDVIEVKKTGPVDIVGTSNSMIRNLLEIRGIGIVNIRQLYGVTAVRDAKKIDLVVELMDWNETTDYDRVGLAEDKYRLLGIDLPLVRIPVRPGRNASAIIELACRNHVLKREGIDSARELEERMFKAMEEKAKR